MSLVALALFLVAVGSASAELTDECLACMCYVSSQGCKMPTPVCSYSEICGPWGITRGYWIDGGQLLGDFYECVGDWQCNEDTVRAYMDRYVPSADATCEDYSRTHAGGPWGSGASYATDYWYAVKDCLDFGYFTPPPQ